MDFVNSVADCVTDYVVTGNNTFCVSSRMNPRHSYTLVANDELDKRHWLQKLNAAIKSKCESGHPADIPAVNTRQHSKKVSKTDNHWCEDVDASFSSFSSSSSLMSSFSLNSVSLTSVNHFVSRIGTMKDADTDSGIVT